MGPHEPYWRTNTSFSPPPPRWNFRFQNEGHSFGSQEGSRLYGSSTSSNSRGSRSWLRGNYVSNHRHSVSDGVGPFFSSPSDLSPAQQWTPPTIQEISIDEYTSSSKRVLGPLSLSPTSEGLSAPHDSRVSISSNSDSSDYEPITKSQNFTTRGCFMSKPVHPLSYPVNPNTSRFHDLEDPRPDFPDLSEPIDPDSFNRSNGHKCNLCERFLSQRSPWSGDMPVIGVLSCRHVFHAECLDQTTPKSQKGDPSCPVCAKTNSPDERNSSKLRIGFPRGCAQGGNGVERNAVVLLNRSRIKKGVSVNSPQSGGGDGVGCSKPGSSSRKKS